MSKLIVFKIGEGNFEQGFPVTLQIGEEGRTPHIEINRKLPPAPELPQIYYHWVSSYRRWGGMDSRIRIPDLQITNISVQDDFLTCIEQSKLLRSHFNLWLRQTACLDLREQILENVHPQESIRVILQTQNPQLQRLPWHLWELFERYPKAEIALSTTLDYQGKSTKPLQGKIKVLAILGGNERINIQRDRQLLEQINFIQLTLLDQPSLTHLHETLWQQSWDILFFAGHSSSKLGGEIEINSTESIPLEALKYALSQAVNRGLQLAIFNSCDGLGLAQNLASLNIPQVIVMREPVPDQVAQNFLKYFLKSFSKNQSFYESVRQAREQLQGLENQFPCATWLPIICQNPACLPLTWQAIEEAQPSQQQLSPEDYRHRYILLNKVKNYWVKGVLEQGLHGRCLIELGLEERLDAVERPWGLIWEHSDQPRQVLPKGTHVTDKFDELGMGRSLLILGEPGSGKTTTLLELARDLLQKAETNPNLPIPVVFNLSSWTHKNRSIDQWLIQELYTKYQVYKELGKELIHQQKLILLLDGLDEVNGSLRLLCVEAINQFILDYGQTEVVICSRIKDYHQLSTRLRLMAAIYLQPLSLDQIQQYLNRLGGDLHALSRALATDLTLQELAQSPLMLSILTLAYQGLSVEQLPSRTLAERHTHLFNAYIERMFNRRCGYLPYSKSQIKRWLILLAKWMVSQSQTVFLIEKIQPTWLTQPLEKWMYAFIISMIGGLVGGIGIGVSVGIVSGSQIGLITGLILGLGGGIGGGLVLVFVVAEIEPVETLKFSGKKARNNLLSGLKVGLIAGIIYSFAVNIIFNIIYGQYLNLTELLSFVLSGLNVGIMFVLLRSLTGGSIETSTIPNQGMWKSLKNALFFDILGILTLGIMAKIIGHPVLFGMIAGLVVGLFSPATIACLQHFVLRLILYFNHYIPWNYARFLDTATGLIFLQKVGGGYIFIHRLLLEHFAKLPLD